MDTRINGVKMKCPPNYEYTGSTRFIQVPYDPCGLGNELINYMPQFEVSLPCTCTPKGASVDWHDVGSMLKGLTRMAEIYRNPLGCEGYKCINASVPSV